MARFQCPVVVALLAREGTPSWPGPGAIPSGITKRVRSGAASGLPWT